jgi:kelch-like protein 1/4/5
MNKRFEADNLCQMLIIEAMRYHLAPEKRLTMKSIRTKPRRSTLGILYCLGGIENIKSKYHETNDLIDFEFAN